MIDLGIREVFEVEVGPLEFVEDIKEVIETDWDWSFPSLDGTDIARSREDGVS